MRADDVMGRVCDICGGTLLDHLIWRGHEFMYGPFKFLLTGDIKPDPLEVVCGAAQLPPRD